MHGETVIFQNQTLHLHPFKGLFWEEQQVLLIADVHIGKAAHFRKAGIAVPGGVVQANLSHLSTLMEYFLPKRVMVLGDLFHSTANSEWVIFREFLDSHSSIQFELIPGNHDKVAKISFNNLPLTVRKEIHTEGPFVFSHHPLEEPLEAKYNLAGHVHPSVRLKGSGRQRLRLPCFYFGTNGGILPAFGLFTGTFDIIPSEEDQVFVIADERVIQVCTD